MQRSREEAERVALEKHGDLEGYVKRVVVSHYQRVTDWACVNCGNTGTLLEVRCGVARTKDCMCRLVHRRKLKQRELLDESNIPELYHGVELAAWTNPGRDQKEVALNNASFHVVDEYVKRITAMVQKGYGLYLTGQNGVGKTLLACAVGNRAAAAGIRVRYYTMAEIVRLQIDGWFEEESKAIVAGVRDAKILIIDDMDKVYKTKTGIETSLFDNLLRERLQSKRPCIFTSNRTIVDAQDDFGPHIYSMLKEHCAELVFVGADYRANMSEAIRRDILNGG